MSRPQHHRGLASTCLVISLLVMLAGCTRSRVQLQPTDLPGNAYSILGEARAFKADGPAGSQGRARASLESVRTKFGVFETAHVLAYDAGDKPAGMQEVAVAADGTVAFDASAGFTYLVYPDIPRLNATYGILCRLGRLHLPRTIGARICTQILCTNEPFQASALPEQVPGLKEHLAGDGLGTGMIGGFGPGEPGGGVRPGFGGGNICDQCIPTDVIYPTDDCFVPIGPPPPQPSPCEAGRLVFSRAGEAPETAHSKIHVMDADGTNDSVLSAADVSDGRPDVNIAGNKILFVRGQGATTGLHFMNVDGTGVTPVANATDVRDVVWGRGGFDFMIFTAITQGEQAALFRINANGTGRTQITHPGTGETDFQPAVLDAKNVVFVRRAADGRTQLFVQDMFEEEQPSIAITTVPAGTGVKLPVAGHVQDNRDLAFVLTFGAFAADKIRVCRFQADGIALDTLHEFELPAPVEHNIFGIDFSADDSCLFVSAQADDVASDLANIARRFELFSVGGDGSGLTRLTTNELADFSPSAITGQ